MTSSERPCGPEKRGPAEIAPSTEPDAKLDKKRSHCISKNALLRQPERQGLTGHLRRLGELVVQLAAIVHEAVLLHCEAGCTSREIAALTGLRSHVVAPRLSKLQSAGRIAKIGRKWDGATERSNALLAAIGGSS